MNKVILMGRLTKDAELRQTTSGTAVARFSVAVNRRFAKEGQPQTDFINCVAWKQTGEFIARYFRKGNMIAIVGSIQTRSWDDSYGNRRYATEVIVDEAYFTGSKAEMQNGGNYAPNNDAPNKEDFEGDEFADLENDDDLPF